MTDITLKDVRFKYPSQNYYIISDISCLFEQGKIYRIVGRNGSGKSTLLKIIAGILKPTSGKIEVYDQTTYLNQDAFSFTAEHLTVREQLLVSGNFESDTIVSKIASYHIGLEKKLDDFVSELSGGQRQIIALLSVILSSSHVVCLDEFMSAMDPVSVQNTLRILKDENSKRKLTILYVSHIGGLFEHEEEVET